MTLTRQCLLLFWLQIKMRLGLSAMNYYRVHDKKKFRNTILIIAAAVYGVGTMLFMYGMMYRAIVKGAIALGLGSLVLALVVLLAMLMALIFGAFHINAIVFNARDIEWYACLPLKQQAVFVSKLGMVYLYELLTTMFILIPAYLLYAIETNAGIGFWAVAILTMPLIPVIPLALSSMLALPLVKLSARFRNREFMTVIFTLILVVGIVAFQLSSSRLMENVFTDDLTEITAFFESVEPMLRFTASVFPPASWLSLALTGGEVLYLLLFLAVTALAFMFAVWLSGKFYYAGILSILETPAAKSKKAKYRGGSVKASGTLMALIKTDIKLLLRSPVYAMNSLTGVIFGVMILIMPLFMRDQWGGMKAALNDAVSSASPALILVIATLIMAGAGLINPAASTSFSRIGRSFWIFRTIPVTPRVQITARIAAAALISVSSSVIIGVCCCIMLPGLIPFAVMALIPSALATVATTAFSMIPDAINPKLKWDSEAEAMKQNMNSMWGMLLAMPPVLILLLALPVAIILPEPNLTVMLIGLLILTAGLAYGCVAFLRWIAESRFNALGE